MTKVNREALADIVKAFADIDFYDTSAETVAKVIITALVKSEIRHCKIEY